jgi:hypothetical protein
MPCGRIYTNEATCTLLLGAEMWERKVFERWMNSVVDPISGRFRFYDSYTCDAYVTLYTDKDVPIYKIRLTEVYPTSIDQLGLDTASSDALLEQSITFSFRNYIPIDITGSEESTAPEGIHNPQKSSDINRPMKGTPIKVANEGAVENQRELSDEAQFFNDRASTHEWDNDLSSFGGSDGGMFNPGL